MTLELTTSEQADEYVSDDLLSEVLDWFEDERGVPAREFIDRLCETYADGWDLDSYYNPAANRILTRARILKRGET